MTQPTAPSPTRGGISIRRRLLSLPTLVSFAIAVALILFLTARFDISLSDTWASLRNANPWLYLLALAVNFATFPFRGARWRLLLKNVQERGAPVPSVPKSALYVLLGWFANSVTWFRLGDAYRAYVYSDDTGASFPRSLGTVVSERVQDVMLVFALLLVAWAFFLASGEAPSWLLIGIAGALALSMLLLLAAMALFRARLARRLPRRVQDAYERFHQGTLGSFHQMPLLLLFGLLGWLAEVGRLYFVVQALDLPVGMPLILFATLGNAVLTLVPVTPAGLGFVETGLTGILVALSTLSRAQALSVTLLDRSISYLSVVVFGALAFFLREVFRRRSRRQQSQRAATT